MIKYNDKVRIIKDVENDGFYIGLEGVVKMKEKDKNGKVIYTMTTDDEGRHFYFNSEDEVELI